MGWNAAAPSLLELLDTATGRGERSMSCPGLEAAGFACQVELPNWENMLHLIRRRWR